MVAKLIGGGVTPGKLSWNRYSRIGAWYWPGTRPFFSGVALAGVQAPSMTARTSRVAGRKVFSSSGPKQKLNVATSPVQGGRKRQRPLTVPVGAPGSTPTMPQSRSVVVPSGATSTPYRWILRLGSVVKPSKRVRTTASMLAGTMMPPLPRIVTSIAT